MNARKSETGDADRTPKVPNATAEVVLQLAGDHPERIAIALAMGRMLGGHTDRRLTIVDLAQEAGLKRHHLTHKHTDLRDLFYAEVQQAGLTREPAVVAELKNQISDLKKQSRERWARLAEVESQRDLYAENLAVAINYIRTLEARLGAPTSSPRKAPDLYVVPDETDLS